MRKIPFITLKHTKKSHDGMEGRQPSLVAPAPEGSGKKSDFAFSNIENIDFNGTFELFSKIAREIQVPTESILAFLRGVMNNPELREDSVLSPLNDQVKNIFELTGELSSTVNELRDVTDLFSNIISFKNERFDILETLNASIYHVASQYTDDVYEFAPNVSPLLQRYYIGDETRLKHIILNILRNSLLDSRNMRVELRVWQEPAKTEGYMTFCMSVCRIMLDGIAGIMSTAKMDQLRLYGGSNLDSAFLGPHMAYAKLMAFLLDGDLTETDDGESNGFIIKIPLEMGYETIIGEELASYLNAFGIQKGKRKDTEDFAGKRALVVDDSRAGAEAAKGLLTSLSLIVDVELCAAKAIERLKKETYDVILMDYLMPEKNGIEASAEIRRGAAGASAKKVPIILLTGNEANEVVRAEGDRVKTVELYLSKPLQREELERALKVVLGLTKNDNGKIAVYSKLFDYDLDITKIKKLADNAVVAKQSGPIEKTAESAVRADYIPGIDIMSGLEKVDNSMEIYVIILGAFCEDIVTWLEVFGNYPQKSSVNDVAIAVHGLKSAANGIGAIDIGTRSLYLEHAAKGGNTEYLQLLLNGLYKDIKKMSDDVKIFIEINS